MLVFNILTNFCCIFSNNKVSQAKRTARETIFYKKLKNFIFLLKILKLRIFFFVLTYTHVLRQKKKALKPFSFKAFSVVEATGLEP